MSQIKAYLLSVTGCCFIISVLLTVVKLPSVKKVLKLCCGCVLILTVLAPLFSTDFSGLKDYLSELIPEQKVDAKEAEQKNMELVGQMIQEQTAQKIAQKAQELGCTATAEVELSVLEGSVYPIPYRVNIHSACKRDDKTALQTYIETELDIPAERQNWVLS